MRRSGVALALTLLATACSGESENRATAPDTSPTTAAATGCADVVAVETAHHDDGTWRFDVTVRSSDTGWDKYADRWEIRSTDGTMLALRELTHPHVDEQPFTRSLPRVELPTDVTTVVVAARDSVEGFCGETRTVDLAEG